MAGSYPFPPLRQMRTLRVMRGRARISSAASIAVLLPILSVVGLHRLGRRPFLRIDWQNLGQWIDNSSLEDATAAIVRVAALVVAYWLAISTASYLIAKVFRRVRMIEVTQILTLPALRKVIDAAVAGSVAAITIASPALGGTHPIEEVPVVAVPEQYEIAPMEETIEIIIVADATLEVVIKAGDNLWDVASRRMEEVLGRTAGDHEVAPYWVEVIQANEDRISSGDPDIVHPGEVILLPPVRG